MRGAELRTQWPCLSPCAVFTLAPACSHHNTGEKVRCTFILHWFRIVLPAGCVYSRYICINDHLMHGLQQGYFASGYKPSTSIWINCEMHLLANIQITLLYYRTFYTIPHFCRGEMCLCAQLLLPVLRYLDDHADSWPCSCICHDSSGVTLSSSAL